MPNATPMPPSATLRRVTGSATALTAVSAMLGAFFILSDPIFNGLAISLIFGLAVSTLLTLLVVPLLYYAKEYRQEGKA
ncbi:hypothetical protein [Vreelandella massiliensis]|uniref:hypothetical protein n=1 Tax=Vreelandella massiliensis TaxID=1816686 RepID=UPI001181921F|nr:hypothetical protein [Halomonas massiliensis]